MTMTDDITHDVLLERLLSLAQLAVGRYDLPGAVRVRLINLSENATYVVEDVESDRRWALRVHREGYHTPTAIQSELAWLIALADDGAARTPAPIPGLNGHLIQSVQAPGLSARNVVLFAWESGSEPDASNVAGYELLGETAARMHAHVNRWSRPEWFERLTWDFETTLGGAPHWGRWRDGMGMTPDVVGLIARTVDLIEKRLARFGKAPGRFGLIHCDMRLANLLVDGPHVKVIDFDDCGFSWFLYDCATTVSFFEHAPEVPKLLEAWVRGYRRVGSLSAEDEAEIGTFVMLRRLLLVAWIGSHRETDLAQSMGEEYTRLTGPLCEAYLEKFAL